MYYLSLNMSIQRISNFYTPNISFTFIIQKTTLDIAEIESNNEMSVDDEDDLLIVPGITDFWKINNAYRNLVSSAGIEDMNNQELFIAIQSNLKKFKFINTNNETYHDKAKLYKSDSFSVEKIENSIEAQVTFMWKYKHYWKNSISAKMNMSWIRVNEIIKKYNLLVRTLRLKKLQQRRSKNLIINDHQVDQIKQFIEQTSKVPVKINMIKQAVWPQASEAKAPWNSTISKVLKTKLGMLYKVLHRWNIKWKDSQNKRLFIESLYFQTKFRNKEIETIYIDEFKFSSQK